MRLVLALLLAACGGTSPVAVEPQDGEPTPWCLRVQFQAAWDPRRTTQATEVCVETEQTCNLIRTNALKWGGRAGLTNIGACYGW